jgi:4-hydroxy-3-methylbut-2-en-1-yl diphosphate reductase
MQVILAQPRGFCAGVVRAIEIVERALAKYGAPVYVRHEIVHNRYVVDALKLKGAVFVEDISEIPEGAITVFSAHGVSRAVEQAAEQRGLPVLDATCPLVAKVHAQAKGYVDKARTLVLIGHRRHPEVEGTMGRVDAKVLLVECEADVATLDLAADAPLAYITQTTLSVDDTRAIIAALHRRFSDVIGPDVKDICYATQNRQAAVRDLAQHADVIIVVGAENSSNSNRLREIGVECGVPSYLIADESELDLDWVRGMRVVGITAGASAPEILVEAVIAKIDAMERVEVKFMQGVEEHIQFKLPSELADVDQPHPLTHRRGGIAA